MTMDPKKLREQAVKIAASDLKQAYELVAQSKQAAISAQMFVRSMEMELADLERGRYLSALSGIVDSLKNLNRMDPAPDPVMVRDAASLARSLEAAVQKLTDNMVDVVNMIESLKEKNGL